MIPSSNLFHEPLFWIVLALVAAVVFLLGRKAPDTHNQKADRGGVINHHHDARVVVTVTMEKRE